MFGLFERRRLIKKGLASPKTRRRLEESEMTESLRSGMVCRIFIFLGFITGLATLIYWGTEAQPAEKFFTALLIFFVAIAQLWINHPEIYGRNSRLLLLFSTMLTHLAITKFLIVMARTDKLDLALAEVIIPFAFAPLICSVLLGRNAGLYAALFVSLWGSLVYKGIDAIFLVMSLICGFIAVFVTLEVRRRGRLIRAGIFVGLATWLLALGFQKIYIIWETWPALNWSVIGTLTAGAIGSGIITALVVGGLVPALESMFGITTNMSWLELSDLNHPLLKRMSIEAAGTYHHSLVVASLAEAAAEAVGANELICRVGAYFHDIGKLVKPDYFTENIAPGENPHDDLAPTMSALIIISHVKEGVDLALKHKLSREIVDIIRQHHGNSLVSYFHRRALQQQEDARAGGKIMNMREQDIPEVREESFRYPGPLPQTRECGIISLADAIESASRSIEKPTPQKIDQLVHDIIESRLLDGQLDDCPLTMRDLNRVSEAFRFSLQNILHTRIAYPDDRNKEGRESRENNRGEGASPASAA